MERLLPDFMPQSSEQFWISGRTVTIIAHGGDSRDPSGGGGAGSDGAGSGSALSLQCSNLTCIGPESCLGRSRPSSRRTEFQSSRFGGRFSFEVWDYGCQHRDL